MKQPTRFSHALECMKVDADGKYVSYKEWEALAQRVADLEKKPKRRRKKK